MNEIADRMIEVITQEGPDTIVYDVGTNLSLGPQGMDCSASAGGKTLLTGNFFSPILS